MQITRTRTLTTDDLRQRLADQRARMAEGFSDTRSGYAECLAYDIEDTHAKLARARRGEVIVEGYDTFFRQWVDMDVSVEAR